MNGVRSAALALSAVAVASGVRADPGGTPRPDLGQDLVSPSPVRSRPPSSTQRVPLLRLFNSGRPRADGRSRATETAVVGGYVLRRGRAGGYELRDERFTARVAPDGSVAFDDRRVTIEPATGGWVEAPASLRPRVGEGRAMVGVRGTFDLTDEIMRALGQQPYRHEKARFLAATFEMRMQMALASQREVLRAALAELPARLEALWRDTRFAPPERRRILFLLWNETDDRPEAGVRASAAIEAFVRQRLPAGSPQAFSDAELDALAAAHGRRFQPYAPPSQAP